MFRRTLPLTPEERETDAERQERKSHMDTHASGKGVRIGMKAVKAKLVQGKIVV